MSIPPDPAWQIQTRRKRYPSPRSTFVQNYLGEVLALAIAFVFTLPHPPWTLVLTFVAVLLGVWRYERDRIRTLIEGDASDDALSKARSPRRYTVYAVVWAILLILVVMNALIAEDAAPLNFALLYGSGCVTNLLIYGWSVHCMCELIDDRARAVADAEDQASWGKAYGQLLR